MSIVGGAVASTARPGNSGSDQVPDFRILPGRYMTALWPSIGLVPTVVHWLVVRSSVRVRGVGPGVEQLAVRQHEHERVQRHPADALRQVGPRVGRRVVDLRQRVRRVRQRHRLCSAGRRA